MQKTDLRTKFSTESHKKFNVEWIVYNDYVDWLENKLIRLLTLNQKGKIMEKYPEFNDLITEFHSENQAKYEAVKEFVEMLNNIGCAPGVNDTELRCIIRDSLRRCDYLESDEYKDELQEKNNTFKIMNENFKNWPLA